jgi:hypothetical protein
MCSHSFIEGAFVLVLLSIAALLFAGAYATWKSK